MTDTPAIRPLRDEAVYEATVAEVRRLWGSEPGTVDGDRLDVLLVLVDAYEAEHRAVELPDPVEAIKVRMEDLGLDRDDLGGMLGIGSGRVSEVLNRRRRLTLDMIRVLATELRLSEACLVQPYELVPSDAARRSPSRSGQRARPERDRPGPSGRKPAAATQ